VYTACQVRLDRHIEVQLSSLSYVGLTCFVQDQEVAVDARIAGLAKFPEKVRGGGKGSDTTT
jgi:hypothetical protein